MDDVRPGSWRGLGLSALWAGLGAAGACYAFALSTQRLAAHTIGLPQWAGEPGVIVYAGDLAAAGWLVLTGPVLAAGLVRISRWKQAAGTRAAGWAGLWVVGLALMVLVVHWWPSPPAIATCGKTDGCALTGYGPSVVSWPELLVCAAFLALAAAMTWTLARPARPR